MATTQSLSRRQLPVCSQLHIFHPRLLSISCRGFEDAAQCSLHSDQQHTPGWESSAGSPEPSLQPMKLSHFLWSVSVWRHCSSEVHWLQGTKSPCVVSKVCSSVLTRPAHAICHTASIVTVKTRAVTIARLSKARTDCRKPPKQA